VLAFDSCHSQLIATVIIFIIGVAFDLKPDNFMDPAQFQQGFPQIPIFYRLLAAVLPAIFLPVCKPAAVKAID